MKNLAVLSAFASFFALSSGVHAAEVALGGATRLMRPSAPNPAWVDSDPIPVPGQICGIRAVRVKIMERDVRLHSVRVIFGNGSAEIIDFGDGRYEAGSNSPWIDVPGRERCVDRLVVSGYTAPRDNPPGQGLVQIMGRVEDRPVVIVVPQPRPEPVYETRTRTVIDRASKELLANPEIVSAFNSEITVNFARAESVGAIELESKYDDAFIDDVVLGFADGGAQKIELGTFRDGWSVRDGAIHLARNQRTGMLDLLGYGERRVISLTIRGREGGMGGANEISDSGIHPVIEVYGVGTRTESYSVCVANCL